MNRQDAKEGKETELKFLCICGFEIRDQTDFLPYAARLLADQDVDEAYEVSYEMRERSLKSWLPLTRKIYQCEDCGRLWIEDHQKVLRSFVPEEASPNILGSIHNKS